MSGNQLSNRRTLIAGIVVVLAGIICVGSGVALLAWRILEPEEAVILPPGAVTAVATPTPGILSIPVAPPPLPVDAADLVILPVSELPTPTPTGDTSDTVEPSPTLTHTQSATTIPSYTPSSSPTITPTPESSESPASLSTMTSMPAAPTATQTLTPTYTVTAPPVAADPAVPDRIVIEKIGLDAPVIPVGQHPIWIAGEVYGQWDVPNERAVGWHQNSAPLGQSGNTVLNGHQNVYGEVFHYLTVLQPGDMIRLESGTNRYRYVVAQTMMLPEEGQPLAVRQDNARWILPTGDERVTLITCWPLDTSTHRFVVIALSVNALDQLTGIP